MIPQLFVESIDLGDGRNINETGRLAKQADGSVVRIGKPVILGTVVSSRKASPYRLLLTVDYREKFAAGRFPGGFSKEKRVQVITKY
jgi:polyribonucleotide nucleotidyltransferase